MTAFSFTLPHSRPALGLILLPIGALLGLLVGRYPLYTLVLALLLAVVYPLLARPQRLLPLLLGVSILGQFGRIPPTSQGSALLILDITAGTLLVLWLLWAIKERVPIFRRTSAHYAWSCFLGLAAISLLLNPFSLGKAQLAIAGFYLLRLAAYSSLVWSIPDLFKGEGEAKRIASWLTWAGFAVVALGFIQLYLLPDIALLARFGWDPHVGRLLSTFLDPNYLGGYLALLLSFVLARSVVERQPFPWVSVLFILLATLLTFSRSGYLAVALVSVLFALRYSWKLVVLMAVVIIPLGFSIPRVRERIAGGFSVDKTSQDRIQSWRSALNIANEFPVIGTGYNTYQAAQESLGLLPPGSQSRSAGGSDSSLLNVLVTTGVLGLFFFLLPALLVLRRARTLLHKGVGGVAGSVALALIMAAPALFVHSFFVNALFYPFILLNIAILTALLYLSPADEEAP